MYRELERAFSRAKYTIKGGEVVVIDGEVVSSPQGETYWVDLEIPEEVEGELMKDLEEGFRNYYTISLNNYPVEDAYLPHQKRVQVEGCW
jgi:formylmethanofuran dehydrogenase subunit A